MKLHFLQRWAYLGWLLLPLTASAGVKAAQQPTSPTSPTHQNQQGQIQQTLQNLGQQSPLSEPPMPQQGGQSQINEQQLQELLALFRDKERLKEWKKKLAEHAPDPALNIDKNMLDNLLQLITLPNQVPPDDQQQQERSQLLNSSMHNLSDNDAKETSPTPSGDNDNAPDLDSRQGTDAQRSHLLANGNDDNARNNQMQPPQPQGNGAADDTKEQFLFRLLYARDANRGETSYFEGDLSDQDASAYAQIILNIGAYYINRAPEDHKDKLLYYFFRPYEIEANEENIDAIEWKQELAKIQKRIPNKQVYKALVQALARQHLLFMHGFTTRWLWENDPTRYYFPSTWYFYSMLGAKLYQLFPQAVNYQGLRVLIGIKVNRYTQVIEGQRTAIHDILYPNYTIYHTIRLILMYMTIFRIIHLFIRLKKQRDNFTLAPSLNRKKIYSHVRGDLRSVFLDLFRDVPWLQDYVLADNPGVINEIGNDFYLFLLFFFWTIPPPSK